MSRISAPHFWIIVAVLVVLGAFLYCIHLGYAYLGYILIFIAALLIIFRFCPLAVRIVVGVLVCLGFIWFWIAEIPVIRGAHADPDPGRKYLIVLGAQVRGDTMSISLQNRADGALEYLEKYPDSIIICSGGQGVGENISEAQAMYNYFVEKGVSPSQLIIEDKSSNTTENLRNSFALIRERGDEPDGNVAIVSSAYHLYRARYLAASLGVKAAAIPCDPGYPFVMLNFFIREAFGVTRLWLLGY